MIDLNQWGDRKASMVRTQPPMQPRGSVGALDAILQALGGQRTKDNEILVHCCSHNDPNPSLSVTLKDGKLLVKCFAGCEQSNVIEDLRALSLWPTSGNDSNGNGVPEAWKGKPRTCLYEYRGMGKELLGLVARFDGQDGKDVVPFFKRDGGKWKAGAAPVPRPLYGLHKLPEHQGLVIICEGEKATDAAQIMAPDCVSMTWPGGSNAVSKADFSPLAGRNVVIWPDADEPGLKAARDVAEACMKIGAASVRTMTIPAGKSAGWDAADALAEGWDISEAEFCEGQIGINAQSGPVSARDKLKALTVKKEYVAMLGKESWLFQNLVIRGQILAIIAKSGGGKSTIFFDFVTPWIIAHHDNMTVFYFDCDSPASDHDRMLRKAEEIGPRFQWINPLTHGKGPEVLVDALKEFVASGERLDDAFFVLDTLKKFIDMLDKKSVKPFFSLLRQLTALGATIALLGHANKHRDNDGNLVFEGVNDVMSDTDALIVFERVKSADGGIDVTTICDPDKGAKVRGLYKPMSFHVAPDRTVTLCQDVVPVPDYSKDAAKRGRLTEEEIQERIREYLEEQDGVVRQKQIIDDFKDEPGASFHAVRKVLCAFAVPEYEATVPGQIFVRAGGLFNQKLYGVCR